MVIATKDDTRYRFEDAKRELIQFITYVASEYGWTVKSVRVYRRNGEIKLVAHFNTPPMR